MMRRGPWLNSLAARVVGLWRRRRRTGYHHRRATPGSAAGRSALAPEELEPRHLLSGVTLITHGYSDDTAEGGWVRSMGTAIVQRAAHETPQATGFTEVQLTVASTDEASLEVALAEVTLASTAPLDSADHGGNIVVYLDWSGAQSSATSEGPFNTTSVSEAITPYLVGQQPITGLAQPLAEQPIHLVGYGRGGSLVGAIAESLGEAGIFVDQVTYLDPNPLAPGDYPVSDLTVPQNVIYADTVWRTSDTLPSEEEPHGAHVPGSYNEELPEKLFTSVEPDLPAGYKSQHANVHLWYHGTIPASETPPPNDGTVDVPLPWYGGDQPGRLESGFATSRTAGLTRPAEGLLNITDWTANRREVDFALADWPSIFGLELPEETPTAVIGETLPLSFSYQTNDSEPTLSFYLDTDRNPYNDTWQQTDTQTADATGSATVTGSQEITTAAVPAGTYFVAAEIRDKTDRVRYAYTQLPVTLEDDYQPSQVTVSATEDGQEEGLIEGVFTVTQSAVAAEDTVVAYSVGGTATADVDYTALSGTVTIGAGATSTNIVVPVLADDRLEFPETVTVTLTALPSASSLVSIDTDSPTATVSLLDDQAAEYGLAGNLGTGGGDALLYVEGHYRATVAISPAGAFVFAAQSFVAGEQAVVVKDVDDGSVTFAVLGDSGPTIALPDNTEADTHRIVATTASQSGILTNTDLFAAFAGLPASLHPFDASVASDITLEENYQLAILGSAAGKIIYQPSGTLSVSGANSKFSLLQQDGGTVDMQLDPAVVLSVEGGQVVHGAENTITVDQAELHLKAGADYFLGGNLQFGPADGFLTSDLPSNGSSLIVLAGGILAAGNSPLVFDSITVESGGTIEPTAASIGLDLQVNTLMVKTYGLIHADARGHAANTGVAAGGASTNGGGGGHGGRGGNGRGANNGGAFNDSSLLPSDFGGGGGSGSRTAGGTGGGRILVTAAGTVNIDGTLSAGGGQGGDNSNGALGGGGAGGTIRIKANEFAGSGLLRANGARGGQDPTTAGNEDGGGGGGAGGRIVVRFKTNSFTNAAGVQAEGGPASGGFNTGAAGGRGTVAFITLDPTADTTVDDTKADDLELELYRSWRWEPAVEGSFDYTKVIIHADTQVVGGGGDVTIHTELFEIEDSSWNTTVQSTNGFEVASNVTINTGDIKVTDSTIQMGNSHQWTVNSTTTYDQSGGSANAQKFDINGSANSNFSDTTVTAQLIEIDGNSLVISNSGAFSTDARGHGSNAGPGGGGVSINGGGGGHGGRGGNGRGATNGGSFNGSSLVPVLLGSGGGNGSRTAGGTGGGAVKINVVGTFLLDGTITSNAGPGGDNSNGGLGGGGAGGSILATSETFAGIGLLQANGARGGQDPTSSGNEDGGGGGGSGGRIAISYQDSTFSTKRSARVDAGPASGGFNPGVAGEVGTIGFLDRDDNHLEIYQGWRWEEQDQPFLFNQLSSHQLSDNRGALIRGGTTSALEVDVINDISLDTGTVWTADGQDMVLTSSTLNADSTTFNFSGQILEIPTELLASYSSSILTTANLTLKGNHHSFTGSSVSGTNFVTRDMGEWSLHGGSNFDFQAYDVLCQTFNQDVGTNIKADARGYGSNAGEAKGGSSTNGGGGGHGGRGGNGHGAANGGAFNDSGLLPNDFGGGGGSGSRSAGGTGGGRIHIVASDFARVNGTISSNGGQGGDNSNGALGGGGAGGTIRIKANEFAGGGLLRANGARGGQDPTTGGNEDGGGGGGAGGRIVVRSKTNSFTNAAGVQAEGGPASGGFNPGAAGGRGTVAFITLNPTANTTVDDTKADDLELELYRSWRWEPSVEGTFAYGAVRVMPDTVVVAGGGDATVTATNFTIDAATWDTIIDSTNGFAASGNVNLTVDNATITNSAIDAGNNHAWNVNATTSYRQLGGTLNGQLLSFQGAADFVFDTSLTATAQRVNIGGNSLLIGSGSTFNLNGRGHSAATGPAPGNSGTTGGGGGHGGTGGNGAGAIAGGGFNGSALAPNELGSGGGNGLRGAGGTGGGAFLAEVLGILAHDGAITANGTAGGSDNNGGTGGGGAGGAVFLTSGSFTGNGLLKANGGAGGDDPTTFGNEGGRGGGGAGGRIFVSYTTSTFDTFSGAEVTGGTGGAGHGAAGQSGSVGTLGFFDRSANQSLQLYKGWRFEEVDKPASGTFSFSQLFSYGGTLIRSGTTLPLHVQVTGTSNLSAGTTWTDSGSDLLLETDTLNATNTAFTFDGQSLEIVASAQATYTGGTIGATALTLKGNQTFDALAATGDTLTVNNSPLLHLTANTQFDFRDYDLHVTHLTLDTGAIVLSDAQGYGSNVGEAKGGASTNGGGGGHGGRGGNGRGANNGGTFNDSSLLPSDFGGGGGSGSRTAGGTGGGRILVTAAGTVNIDGTLSAGGGQGGDNSNGALGGGGAGGTIRIKANEFAGSGLLRANGARGGQDPTTAGNEDGGGGGGAGGRIVVRFKTNSFTNAAGVQAEGGPASGGFNTGAAGGRGTVAFITLDPTADTTVDDTKADDLELELYRSWRWEPSEEPYSYQNVTIHPNTIVMAGSDANLTASELIMTGATWDMTIDSTNNSTASGNVNLTVGNATITNSAINVGNSHAWLVNATNSYTQTGGTLNAQTVDIHAAAEVTFSGNTTVTGQTIDLAGGSLTVAAGTTLSTDGRGYAATAGPGAGTTASAGSGGGHGGSGGNGAGGSTGGMLYDSALLPNDFGSGGGNGHRTAGGAGGGRILVTAAQAVTIDGMLSAGGTAAADDPNGGTGGGGAGGTIRITADTFSGGGLLKANGGNGGADTVPYYPNNGNGNGGGGGGGRIAVYTDSETFTTTGDVQAEEGNGGTGFGPTGQDGQVGTVRFLNIRPVITLIGEITPLLEAIPTENYVEAGATAVDSEDGDISQDIEVSGDVVDRGQPGIYEIHYDVSDSEGNAATQVTRSVTVQDTLPPVLALHLSGEVIHVSDNTATGLGGEANTDATQSTSTTSTSVGNVRPLATSLYRETELVQPDGTPVMSRQDWVQRIAAASTAAELPTYTTWDHQDPAVHVTASTYRVDLDGNGQITLEAEVDFTQRSTYLLKYDALDASANYAERAVFGLILDDPTPPVLNVAGGNSETVQATSDWTLAESTASDNIDGDLTSSIRYQVTNTTDATVLGNDLTYEATATLLDTSMVGDFVITMTVSDQAGIYGHNNTNNLTTAHKAVRVQDTLPPVITLVGEANLVLEATHDSDYLDLGATAFDLHDGILSHQVEVSGDLVNLSREGIYAIRYNVEDTAGNAAQTVTRTVMVQDTLPPVITLAGDAVLTFEVSPGDTYADLGATAYDSIDGDISHNVHVSGSVVDLSQVGIYTLYYDVEDTAGNDADTVSRTVQVTPESDFGDAPSPYPVTRSEDGAHHMAVGPTLGTGRDTEPDGTHSVDALADDNTTGDDEDGVTFSSLTAGGPNTTVTVHVQNAPGGAKLDAWIDLDANGHWDEIVERIADSIEVTNGDNTIFVEIPTWAKEATTYARFRLSTTGSLLPTGPGADGEVEDYQVTITAAPQTLPGDYNLNGFVDAADYTVWRDYLGQTIAHPADGDGNGVVDQNDYTIWRNHFGTHLSGTAATNATPNQQPLAQTSSAGSAMPQVTTPTTRQATTALKTATVRRAVVASQESPVAQPRTGNVPDLRAGIFSGNTTLQLPQTETYLPNSDRNTPNPASHEKALLVEHAREMALQAAMPKKDYELELLSRELDGKRDAETDAAFELLEQRLNGPRLPVLGTTDETEPF